MKEIIWIDLDTSINPFSSALADEAHFNCCKISDYYNIEATLTIVPSSSDTLNLMSHLNLVSNLSIPHTLNAHIADSVIILLSYN